MKPADIAKLIEPSLADLKRDVALLIAEHANAIVAEVRTAAIDGVRARLTGGGHTGG
jgi:hypothetical protein